MIDRRLLLPMLAAAAALRPRVAMAANTAWSPTDKVNTTLSGNNLIATSTGVSGVRASDSKVSGKFYWEVAGTVVVNSGGAIGIATAAANLTNLAGNGTGAALIYRSGHLYINNLLTISSIGAISGATICIAVDFGAALIWIRAGAAGDWNANAANNPATAVGGANFTSIGVTPGATAVYPVGCLGQTNDVLTANFGDSAFVGAVPAGFTAGFPAGSLSTPTTASAGTLGLGIN